MIDLRLRTQIPDDELTEKMGKILTPADYNLLVTGPAFIRKPDGSPLAVYLPAAIPQAMREQAYPVLHGLRHATTSNRGTASGTERVTGGSGKRSYSREVPSAIIGSFDPTGPRQYCRLTAFTGAETEKMRELHPLLRLIGARMREHVPERWRIQHEYVQHTSPDWVIPGTPFTTVTVNNTWATATHTDKGDLERGFSNLAVLRRGGYTGGVFCFPRYRVAFDTQDGDLILMDAHAEHGNTAIRCTACGETLNGYHECGDHETAERISVVAYYRSKMHECGTATDEAEKARVFAEQRAEAAVGQ